METSKRRLAARLSAGLAVAALLYVGRACSLFAAFLLVYMLVEQAWGVAGVASMVAAVGSIACGLTAGRVLRHDAGQVRHLVMVGAGAIVLLFAAAALLAVQMR